MTKNKSQGISKSFPMKELRESLGMNQQQFATALGVSTTKISTAERGLTEPVFTIKEVKTLCKLLGKAIEELPDYLGKDYDQK